MERPFNLPLKSKLKIWGQGVLLSFGVVLLLAVIFRSTYVNSDAAVYAAIIRYHQKQLAGSGMTLAVSIDGEAPAGGFLWQFAGNEVPVTSEANAPRGINTRTVRLGKVTHCATETGTCRAVEDGQGGLLYVGYRNGQWTHWGGGIAG